MAPRSHFTSMFTVIVVLGFPIRVLQGREAPQPEGGGSRSLQLVRTVAGNLPTSRFLELRLAVPSCILPLPGLPVTGAVSVMARRVGYKMGQSPPAS